MDKPRRTSPKVRRSPINGPQDAGLLHATVIRISRPTAQHSTAQTVVKVVSTAGDGLSHPVKSVCTKSFVGWGFALDPTEGAYIAPPDTLAAFKGPYV